MSVDPTTAAAIFDPRASALVVASAGSGKTWRLVRRYLKIVGTHDPDTDRAWARPEAVVAVTFTRAAAAEMRERVFTALATERDTVDPDDLVLRQVLATHDAAGLADLGGRLAAAPIGTLHSLCAQLLRRFPELCGVPPNARPLDPGEHRVRLERFVRREIDTALDDPTHAHHGLCRALLRDRPLERLRADLRALVDDERELPSTWTDPDVLARVRQRFLAGQARAIASALAPECESVLRAIPRALEARAGSTSAVATRVREALAEAREVCETILAAAAAGSDDHVDIPATLPALSKVSKLKRNKDLKEAQAPIEALRHANQIESRIRSRVALKSAALVDLADRTHESAMARWIELALDLRARYADELRREGLLRYGDLERLALELLRHPAAEQWLAGTYTHILVDEFQDTSELQIQIVHALARACGGATTFYVGDPKQSIYRFRGADVDVFMGEVETAARDDQVLALPNSRRPSPALTKFLNAFFTPLFTGSPKLGPEELEAVDDGASVPWETMTTEREGEAMSGPPVDLLLRGEIRTEPSQEAGRIARHVRGLLAQHTLNGRPLARRDIAVLVPVWRFAEDVRAALESEGIAAEVSGGRGLLPLPEVRDLIAALRFWAASDDELAAVSIARGPCFAISDLGLYALTRWPGVSRRDFDDPERWVPWDRSDAGPAVASLPTPTPRRSARSLRSLLRHARLDPNAALDAMVAAGVVDAHAEPELRARLRADARALEANRDRFATLCADAGVRPTADLLADAIAEFTLEASWLASSRGRRAIANAWKFVEVVRSLEPDGPDLRGVVDWLESGTEPAPEGLISGESDAVTITTFHGAKGKEWPVVFVAGLGRRGGGFGGSAWDSSPVPTADGSRIRVPRMQRPNDGFWAEADPLSETCSIASAPLEAAEEKRLLYVAMTRARDRLILSGELPFNAHIGKDDRSQVIPNFKHRDPKHQALWDRLDGSPRPLYLCRTVAEFVLAALHARRPRRGAPMMPSHAAGAGAALAELTRCPTDAEIDASAALLADPPIADPPRMTIDLATVERSRGASLAMLTPSVDRSPWSSLESDWTIPLPDPAPVMPPEAVTVALDPRELGELFHRAMERWGFRGDPPSVEICAALASTFAPDHAHALGVWLNERVGALADTELAAELHAAATARRVFHEVPLDSIVDGYRVRGQIDLLWRDPAGLWCVLDYKVTRRVTTADDLHSLADEYAGQLVMYRKALSRWRPGGQMPFFGRFGLWLAPSARAMWMQI